MERLAQKRSCQWQRLSSETEEQRAARLVQLRSCKQQRLSFETEEQRAARLVPLRNCQQQSDNLAVKLLFIKAHKFYIHNDVVFKVVRLS